MTRAFSDAELAAYLDETLAVEEMSRIESAMRIQPELLDRLKGIHRRRDSGHHSLGEIWSRQRLSCPSREELGSFLLGALGEEEAGYIEFHVFDVGCRICAANAEDLQQQRDRTLKDAAEIRRRKYFQTSAGLLSIASDSD